jgi:hypothetical protein
MTQTTRPLSVSVIIPTFNREHLIGRAIASVLPQLTSQDELLVVDDGSTDNTRTVLAQFQDKRIRYMRQRNQGAGAARNRGTHEAARDLIAFLDSDDVWLPGKLDMQVRFMASRSDVFFCFTDFIREYDGKQHRRSIRFWHTDPRSWTEIMGPAKSFSNFAPLPSGNPDFPVHIGSIYHGELQTNYVLTSSFLVRRVECGRQIQFTEGVRLYEDWECFARVARLGNGAFLDVETAIQLGHSGPRLSAGDALSKATARLMVLQHVWGSDPEFLARHGDEYRQLWHEQELERIRALIGEGRVREARTYIAQSNDVPLPYTFASRLPSAVILSLVSFRRLLMKLTPASRRVTHLEPA